MNEYAVLASGALGGKRGDGEDAGAGFSWAGIGGKHLADVDDLLNLRIPILRMACPYVEVIQDGYSAPPVRVPAQDQ